VRASAVSVTGVMCDWASGAGSPTVTVVPPTAVASKAVSKARGWPTHSMTTGALRSPSRSGVKTSAAPSSFARTGLSGFASPPVRVQLRAAAGDAGAHERQRRDQRGPADSAEADDHHLIARVGTARVAPRSPAGEHGAAEHRSDRSRNIIVDGHDRGAIEDCM